MTSRAGWAVLAALAASWMGGCGLLPASNAESPSATADAASVAAAPPQVNDGWPGRYGITFTMDLPAGWNDLTVAYAEEVPDTALAAFFTTGQALGDQVAFATISTDAVGEDTWPRDFVAQDLESFAESMTDPVFTPGGPLDTVAGGAGWWGSVTGVSKGRVTTIHSVHVLHGPYEFMALIESYEGEDAAAAALLEAVKTLNFTAPEPIDGRHGAPLAAGGVWTSYCGLVVAPEQDWGYDFWPAMDATPWRCPEDTDYLGGWVVPAGESYLTVSTVAHVGSTLEAFLMDYTIPGEVGDSLISDAGYTYTLRERTDVVTTSGFPGVKVAVDVTDPGGVTRPSVSYFVSLGATGAAVTIIQEIDGAAFTVPSDVESFALAVAPASA